MSKIEIAVPDQPDEQKALVIRGQTWAADLTISTPEERAGASNGVSHLKTMVKQIVALFADAKTAANAAHKAVCEAEKKLRAPVDAAIQVAEQKLLFYDRQVREAREREQAALQAIADEKARRERERLEREAAKLKTPELRQARLEEAAAIVAPVVQVACESIKVAGEVKRVVWKAELLSITELAKAAGNKDFNALSLIDFNQGAANRMASMLKTAGAVPGVRFYSEETISHRTT